MKEENVCQVFKKFSINYFIIIYFSLRKSVSEKRNYKYLQKKLTPKKLSKHFS